MKPLTCESNEYYGHGHILRAYAGIDQMRRLRGRIQHGWAVYPNRHMLADEATLCHEPFYAWAARDAHAVATSFHENVHIIGAPALYDSSLWLAGSDLRYALAIPIHSLAGEKTCTGWQTYVKELIAWHNAHGQEVRVLLYIRDFERADVRAIFDAGEIVQVCAGEVTAIDFLPRLFGHLRSAQIVLTSCVQTACFYALALGKPAQLYGSPVKIADADETAQASFRLVQDPRLVARVFPSIYAGRPDRGLGRQHLGAEFKRSLDEIRNLEWL